MISVITACYNSSKTIERTIQSMLNQTDRNFEHIFIDGLSKDNTIEIIEKYHSEYEKSNIQVIVISEKDNGLYDAINKGISIAQGDYIGILNSDDWYESNTIELVHSSMRENPDADVIMGASTTINGNSISVRKPGKGKIITSRNFNHGAMFVSQNCFKSIGVYADDNNYYDDFMWYIRALKNNKKFVFIDNVLYNFSCGGMSTRKSLKEAFYRIRLRYDAYRKNGCSRLYIVECIIMEIGKYLLVK